MKLLQFICLLFVFVSCGGTQKVRLIGQIVFTEDWGCTSPVGGAQDISWTECHEFKNHLHPSSGAHLGSSGAWLPGADRPMQAKVVLFYYAVDPTSRTGVKLCDLTVAQTNALGYYVTEMKGCGSNAETYVIGNVLLEYDMKDVALEKKGTIRALWRENEAQDLYEDLNTDEVRSLYTFSRVEGSGDDAKTIRMGVPRFFFRTNNRTEPDLNDERPTNFEVGKIKLLSAIDADTDDFGYGRQLLSSFNTIVSLHRTLKFNWDRSSIYGRGRYFDMFVDDAPSRSRQHYNIFYDNTWAYGWKGGISIYKPFREYFAEDADGDGAPDGSWRISRLFSGTEVLGHEFGHSVQATFAPRSFVSDYSFSNPLRRNADNAMPRPDDSEGRNYDWGHAGGQYQELGTAFSEGVANSIGQWLFNRCEGFIPTNRPIGGANPFSTNQWNPDISCDDNDGCSFHAFRAQMHRRGVDEGSEAWNQRLSQLRGLNDLATLVNHQLVTSNSESKIGEFGCDLMDTDRDVSQVNGLISPEAAPFTYIPNYTGYVAEILNGASPIFPAPLRMARVEPDSEDVTIGLDQFLHTMSNFCDACNSDSLSWDFTSSTYVRQRVNVYTGHLSAQKFLNYMISEGMIDRTRANNLLRSNFMEPMP